MVDEQTIQANEKLLQNLLQRGDKKFLAQVGLTGLALLTEQFPTDQYQEFLKDCVTNAAELHKVKVLGLTKPVADDEPTSPESQQPGSDTPSSQSAN